MITTTEYRLVVSTSYIQRIEEKKPPLIESRLVTGWSFWKVQQNKNISHLSQFEDAEFNLTFRHTTHSGAIVTIININSHSLKIP